MKMATKKMIDMVNQDRKLAVLFGGMVFDGIILVALILASVWIL